jgi:hypothetical protein
MKRLEYRWFIYVNWVQPRSSDIDISFVVVFGTCGYKSGTNTEDIDSFAAQIFHETRE